MEDQGTTPPRRIRRNTSDGMLGGVAAGFARYLAVDVVWVRLAFVLTTVFAGGLGLVAYIAAWIIVPAEDDPDAAGGSLPSDGIPDGARGARFWVGVGLISLGSVVLLDRLLSPLQARFGWVSPSQLLVPMALILIGALVWRSSRSDLDLDRIEQDAERLAARVEDAAEAAGAQLERWADEGGSLAGRPIGAQSAGTGNDNARLAPATLGTALIAAGSVWLLRGLGMNGATLTRALAAALLVIGIGLLVGAFLGRGRGLIGAGLLLAPLVLLSVIAGPAHAGMRPLMLSDGGGVITGPEGRIEERPGARSELRDTYTYGVGNVELDLRGVDAAELAAAGTTSITVELGIGDLLVLLPEDVTVVVRVELGIGQIDVDGRTSGGLGVSVDRVLPGTTEGAGTLIVDIEQGIGRVRVTR